MKAPYFKMIFAGCIVALLLVACNDVNVKLDAAKQSNEEHQADAMETVGLQQVAEDVLSKDQGDLNIWFEGDVSVDNGAVTVEGHTNLLPTSLIQLVVKAQEGAFIGTNDRAKVKEDGTFSLSTLIPNQYSGSLLHIEVYFRPEDQENEIKSYYENKMNGDFKRVYTELGVTLEQASYRASIPYDERKHVYPIVRPVWTFAEDLGEVEIRFDIDEQINEDYVAISLESNLLEGAWVEAWIDVPNYITSGLRDGVYTNPDGSAVMFIQNPESVDTITKVTDYTIKVTFDPKHANNREEIQQVYGERGEHFFGESVRKDEDYEGSYMMISAEKNVTIQ